MPHVDDGTLHALLDGALRAHEPDRADRVEAHLDACADCRARLEEAAALRDRAADVLADLDAEPAPDFEDVLARAAGSAGTDAGTGGDPDHGGADPAPGLRRRLAWTRGLAWAATLVVALGTGYLVRDLADPTGVVPRTGTTQSADRVAEAPTGAEANAMREGGMQADAPDRASPEPRSQTAEPEALADRRPAAGEAAGAAKTTREELLETTPEVEAADAGAPTLAPVGREELGVGNPAADARWRAVSVEEAEDSAGPLLVLPGATIATAELADGGSVRTHQRLPEGVEVVVTQEVAPTAAGDRQDQAGADPMRLRAVQAMPPSEAVPELVGLDLDSAAAAAESPVTVTVLRDGRALTLTAPLPEDVLLALAATAAPRTP